MAGGCADLSSFHIGAAVSDVLGDGVVEKKRVLRDDADLARAATQREIADVTAIERYCAGKHVIEARHQVGQRCLPRAARADQRYHFARANFQIDAAELIALPWTGSES